MASHSANKKSNHRKKSSLDSFFDKLFGRNKKHKKHLHRSLLEREDFEIEADFQRSEIKNNSNAVVKETEPVVNEDVEIEVAAQEKTDDLSPQEKKKISRQEYLRIWGIEEDKGFFKKLTDSRPIRRTIIPKPLIIQSKKFRKVHKRNKIDSFFSKLFGGTTRTHTTHPTVNKEAKEKKEDLKRKKRNFLKRMRKHREKGHKKGNWFTNLFKQKNRDPFLKQQEPETSLFSEVFKTNKYTYFFFNSLFLFLTAYIVVYLLYQFTVLFSASLWNLDSVLYYWDLAFDDYSPKWNKWNIIAVTFSGPFISIVTAILFLKVLFNIETLNVSHRHFILWISLHGFNRFLGGFVAGVITDEGFGYVVNWMYIPEFIKILLMILAVFLLGVIGYFTTRQFLDISGSFHYIRKANKKAYLFSQAVLPSIVGSILLILIKLPNNAPYETIIIGTFIFLTIPTLFNFRANPTPVYTTEKIKNRFYFKYFIAFIILMVFYRVILDSGLHFKINIDISISNARYFKF